jgi:hypothetical protein
MNLSVQQVVSSRGFKIYSGLGSLYFLCSSFCQIKKNKQTCNLKTLSRIIGLNILKSIIWPGSLVWYGCKCISTNKPCSWCKKKELNKSVTETNNPTSLIAPVDYYSDNDSDNSDSGSDSSSRSSQSSDSASGPVSNYTNYDD